MGPAAAGVWRIMSAYILIYMCKYICPRQTDGRPRVLLWIPLLIRPRPGCDSRAKQAASKLHFLLPSSCNQRHPSRKFSLSCFLLPAPALKWICVSSIFTSLPLSCHFSAVISQLGESQEGGREGGKHGGSAVSDPACLPTHAKREKKR